VEPKSPRNDGKNMKKHGKNMKTKTICRSFAYSGYLWMGK
jgi:hypothetical protein